MNDPRVTDEGAGHGESIVEKRDGELWVSGKVTRAPDPRVIGEADEFDQRLHEPGDNRPRKGA